MILTEGQGLSKNKVCPEVVSSRLHTFRHPTAVQYISTASPALGCVTFRRLFQVVPYSRVTEIAVRVLVLEFIFPETGGNPVLTAPTSYISATTNQPLLCRIAALSAEVGSLLSVQSAPDRPEQRDRPNSLAIELPLATVSTPDGQCRHDRRRCVRTFGVKDSRNRTVDLYQKRNESQQCVTSGKGTRWPVSLNLSRTQQQVGAYLSALSPQEQEEDSLLTLSSVTARPLLAASRALQPAHQSAGSNSDQEGSVANAVFHYCYKVIKSREGSQGPGGGVILSFSVDSPQPLDGGYGWVVVAGAFMVQFCVAGLFKSYGVLYVEITETFPGSSESVASWIPAALSTLCLALAPLSSAMCEKYSCRVVVFVGGLFCAAGLALSYFSTTLIHLLLSFGIMTGR
ncbi:Monocarboxylate transporter 12 [Eumeta japonica]|uniref:Monocarboxylate transporter 12 n=1 Tax=Eumeta variegata TaxID=151549 RepID=A0A4C1YII3_EUMVA|nr:Monocarboxylate transporter 12 [Eumeta japonica]